MSAVTAVAEREDHVPAPPNESAAILNVIERMALNPEIDPDRIERFIALKERIDANQAKVAFNVAIAEAKSKIGPIVKNRKGHQDKTYADLAAIAKAIDPILTALGLSYRFRTEQSDRISVTCIVSGHGHSEENTLAGPADASGSKNAIQAIGSTLTYLQRYTLVQAFGLTAADDDDGKAAGIGEAITDDQLKRLQALASEVGGDVAKLCDHFKIDALPDLPASKFDAAVKIMEMKRARVGK